MMILRSSHNKFFSLIVVLLLIIGSIRGAIVIHFGFDHYIVYPIVAGLLLMLSMYGVLCSVAYKDKILSLLKVMLAVNIILFVIVSLKRNIL